MDKSEFIKLYNLLKPSLLEGPDTMKIETDEEKINFFKNPISLDLTNELLNALPDNFHNLAIVDVLYYCDQKDEYLSDKILNLRNIEFLYLRNNRLKELPKEINRLKKLKVLFVDNNNLKDLPNELCDLKELYLIDCDSNNFQVIPKVLYKMKNLKVLNLAGMQIKNEEVIKLKEELPSCEIDMSSDPDLKLPF